MEKIGACRYCGQMIVLDVPEETCEEQLNYMASEMCGCIGSRYLKKAAAVKAEIERITENEDELKVLDDAVNAILYGPVKTVSMTFDDNKKISIKKNRGEVTITKARTEKQESKV